MSKFFKQIDPEMARALHRSIYENFRRADYIDWTQTVLYVWTISARGYSALRGHYVKMSH